MEIPVAVWPVRKRCGVSIQPEQLLCPVLVGREDELALLRGALDRAVQGHACGLFVGGEAGIGKSRLCRALLKDARLRGLHPLVGLSSPQETGLPYGPIVDALRRAFTRMPLDSASLHAALGPVLPTLARTVSMLRAKRVAHQIDLRPLTAAQVAGLLGATLGRSLPADVMEALCK